MVNITKTIILGTAKVCHKVKLTQEDAMAIIVKRWMKPKEKSNEKSYYYCKECDAFHTTSMG